MPGLKKNERLKKGREITRLYQEGKILRGKNVHLVFQKSETRKVAFAVTKSCGGSVKRNFIKRRLREAYRRVKETVDAQMSYLFIGLPGILHCTFETLQNEIADLAAKVAKHGSNSS